MRARLAIPADDDTLKSIVMHPSVRQWNELDGPRVDFDPSKYTGARHSFAVVIEDKLGAVGCFLAFAIERCAYTIHTNLLPSCRGARATEAATAALEFAFTQTDAEQLWTMVPDSNQKALWFAHFCGFRNAYEREGVWKEGGALYAVQYLRMDIDDWVLEPMHRERLAARGDLFHERLAGMGAEINHGKDAHHDAYVGAAWAMAAAGRINKGMWLYGRWARVAGYQPFAVLSEEPLRIDIGTCVLRVDDGEFVIEEPAHA